MVRKFSAAVVAVVLAIVLVPSTAQARFEAGNWEATFGGSAFNDNEFKGFSASASGSLGYFLSDAFELGVRQSFSFSDFNGSDLNGSTRVFADYHFNLGDVVVPFVGANIGYVYGDTVHDTWAAAPEVGLKVFVNDTTFLYGIAEYQFFFDNAGDANDNFDDGQFVYSLGIGFRW